MSLWFEIETKLYARQADSSAGMAWCCDSGGHMSTAAAWRDTTLPTGHVSRL